jgi:hypothetical protein
LFRHKKGSTLIVNETFELRNIFVQNKNDDDFVVMSSSSVVLDFCRNIADAVAPPVATDFDGYPGINHSRYEIESTCRQRFFNLSDLLNPEGSEKQDATEFCRSLKSGVRMNSIENIEEKCLKHIEQTKNEKS